MLNIAIFPTSPNLHIQAEALAEQLNLPIASNHLKKYDYLLLLTPDYLALQKTSEKSLPLYVDFLSAKMQYRRQHMSLKREALARALGLKNKSPVKIIDATAGLARDSFVLACLGFEVTLLERSPITHALVQDGIQHALQDAKMAPIVERLHLIQSDAITWLKKLTPAEYPDIIYLDPMFPERQKSALVKKEMRLFHDIVGDDQDADALLKIALTCAIRRVVVKRPRAASPLAGVTPSFHLAGSSSRFDIYLT